MGYTVELQGTKLHCLTRADAEAATIKVTQHTEMCPYHLVVSPRCLSNPPRDDTWALDVDHFVGDHWHDDEAINLWLGIAPHLADGSTIEFQGEDGWRWRIRWTGDRVVEERVQDVIWVENRQLLPPQKGSTP